MSNKQRVELQAAFILHTRPYRDTSLIVELFTQDYGRVPAVARAGRTRKAWQGLLQPFTSVLVSWTGAEELMTLTNIEPNSYYGRLVGRKLLSGFYLNELLMRLLHRHDPHPELFKHYQAALLNLYGQADEQRSLRIFEKQLLDELGYGLIWRYEAGSDKAIDTQLYYQFDPQHGLLPINPASEQAPSSHTFTGQTLLAIANEDFSQVDLGQAKRLMRLALAPLLGDKPLKTRDLFYTQTKKDE